jgi:protein ImuB
MARWACVDVPALPLQSLVLAHPTWATEPVVVVAEDRPTAHVLWVNEAAFAAGVRVGHRYAAALSIVPMLHASVVPQLEVARASQRIAECLYRFTPNVEVFRQEPGVYWLDAEGLGELYDSASAWARAIREALEQQGFVAHVVVGFSRFGTYAIAKLAVGTHVFKAPELERIAAEGVPLARVQLEVSALEGLERLGIYKVGDFLRLPAGGLLERFGVEVHALHRLAAAMMTGDTWDVVKAERFEQPLTRTVLLDEPDNHSTRLLFLIKRLLEPLLVELASRQQALTVLAFRLVMERSGAASTDSALRTLEQTIAPAAPTLDREQLLGLVRLRIEGLRLPSGVEEVCVTVTGIAASVEQLRLFAVQHRRDQAAADRALARLRARFGEASVVRATLRSAHLPEAGFAWEPMTHTVVANPVRAQVTVARPLVRRMYTTPVMLPARPRREPNGWMLNGFQQGRVVDLTGPYVVSGGWWKRLVEREYFYAETDLGAVYWIYFDRPRNAWLIHGRVE